VINYISVATYLPSLQDFTFLNEIHILEAVCHFTRRVHSTAGFNLTYIQSDIGYFQKASKQSCPVTA